MTPRSLAATLAALTLVAGTGVTTAASAADYGTPRGYSYNENRIYHPAPQQRPVARDFDEDDAAPRYSNRPDHHDSWRHNRIQSVEARASYAGGYMPYYVKEWRAKREAIEIWKSRVTNLYGPDFAHWRTASNQRVDCGGGGTVYCTVSATPARGFSRWGWYGAGRDRAY